MPATLGGLNTVFAYFISGALVIIGMISIIMIVIGGINYIGSGGDKEGMAKSKATITYAIVGLILAVSAWMILSLFGRFLGVNITTFDICFHNSCDAFSGPTPTPIFGEPPVATPIP